MNRLLLVCLLTGFVSVGCSSQDRRMPEDRLTPGDLVYAPPSPETIPGGQRGELIRLGYEIVVRTQDYAQAYVGNSLSCASCHLDAGLNPNAAPFVGLAAVYPEYRARAGRVVTLAERVNECVERNLNGRPLPPDSSKLEAVVAYITWLSEGVPAGSRMPWRGLVSISASRPPDPANGSRLYQFRCAFCHGADGAGTMNGPPVWGTQSFTVASEMARPTVLASYVKANMPRGWGWSLSDNEAHDVAKFIAGQARPDLPGKQLDWPRGGKPPDIPY